MAERKTRRRLGAAGIIAAVVGVGPMTAGIDTATASPLRPAYTRLATKSAAPVNLIRDPGAEGAKPDADGDKVGVSDWTAGAADNFTSVAYGTSGFPDDSSPGPTHRGHNFFAGGQSGDTSTGTQTEGLAAEGKLIRSGRGHFTLSGWLGGYSSQGDHATLRISWETSSGAVLGTGHIGPVSAAQRGDVTGMLYRIASGTVPRAATRVLVTLVMVRTEGEYVDGYADNLSLTVHK